MPYPIWNPAPWWAEIRYNRRTLRAERTGRWARARWLAAATEDRYEIRRKGK